MWAAEFEYKTALLRAAYRCYETLERRRWIRKPSTTTKSTPDTTWIRVTLFMAISFLVDFSPGYGDRAGLNPRQEPVTGFLRNLRATALDENSQHNDEEHTGYNLDQGDAVHG
jgi:hypothetical protein